MKYPLIPITSITADINSELKRLIRISNFSDEDIYSWGVDAARQIVDSVYGTEDVYLTVSKHVASVPLNLYLLESVYLCDPVALSYTNNEIPPSSEPMRWIKSKIIRPADKSTLRHCSKGCNLPGVNDTSLTFSLKIPPNVARFSFHTGKVYMKFLSMHKNSDGVVMMQDEINSINAVKAYIKMMLLEERLILGDVNINIYNVFKQQWDDYLSTASRNLKFPSAADSELLAIEQDQRFRKFRYRN